MQKQLEANKIIFDALVASRQEENYFIDSTKDIIRSLLLSKYLCKSFNFKYIFLYRNGLANLNSWLKTEVLVKKKNGEIVKYKAKNRFNSPRKVIGYWKKVNLKTLFLLMIFNKSFFPLSYDLMLKNPEDYIKKNLLPSLSLDYEEQILDFNSSQHHMVGGNASRINAVTVNPLTDQKLHNITSDLMKTYKNKTIFFRFMMKYIFKIRNVH